MSLSVKSSSRVETSKSSLARNDHKKSARGDPIEPTPSNLFLPSVYVCASLDSYHYLVEVRILVFPTQPQ